MFNKKLKANSWVFLDACDIITGGRDPTENTSLSACVWTDFVCLFAVPGVSSSSGMARLLEELRPHYCDQDGDPASCEEALVDPSGVLIKTLYRLAGVQLPPSGKKKNNCRSMD